MEWELLRALPEDERETVLRSMNARRFRRGDTVFHAGDAGDSIHVITSGRAAVRLTTPAGEIATLTVLGPGQTFGEMALLRRSAQRTATVLALEPLETRVLHRDAFTRLCRDHPVVERLLVAVLAARVDRLSQHLVEALYLPVEQRLVRRLLETARLYAGEDGAIVLPLTQEDVAAMSGTTRPTANGVLRDLQNAGLIELARGRVRLLDLAGLTRRAS